MYARKSVDTFLKKLEKNFVTHNQIEVSKSALLHNLDLFSRMTMRAVIPVLKGNAYGHGIALVAEALKGQNIPYIAVDGYFEALRIREVSDQPVLIMGAILPENYKNLKYDNFAFVVDNETSIRALGKTGKRVKVHLEINTGMNRYGAKPDDVVRLVERIMSYKNLILEGIMSHLADSDGYNPRNVDTAVMYFDLCVEKARIAGAKPKIIHIAQSAGSLRANSRHANTVRLGIGLYGMNPFPPKHSLYDQLFKLQPALQLVSTITKTIDLKKGEKVSYNYTFTAKNDMRIGILPLGYYEGVPRTLGNKGAVKFGDVYLPIIGKICMNHTMINLEKFHAKEGDKVIVYSSNPTDHNAIDTISQKHRLFSYNLLTDLSSDVRRILVR